MPTDTSDQQITIPVGPDAADAPVAFTNQTADIESRLWLRYASEADRTARHAVGIEGEVSHLADVNRSEIFDGTNWISLHPRAFYGYIRKTANETVNNSTALQPDNELLIALPTAGTFGFSLDLFYSSSTTADIKFSFPAIAGASGTYGIIAMAVAGALAGGDGIFTATTTFGTAIPAGGSGVGNGLTARIEGEITMGGTAGNLQLEWAQNTLDATDTVVRSRSRLRVWRSA